MFLYYQPLLRSHSNPRLGRYNLDLLGSFLLVSDCFLLTLASAGVVLGALSAEGETKTVTDTTVATDIHQSLDVHLHLGAECAFHFVLIVDDVAEGVLLVIGPVLHLLAFVDAGLGQDLFGSATSDTVDIFKPISPLLFLGKSIPAIRAIDSFYSCCLVF